MADRRKIRWVLDEYLMPYLPESFLKAMLRCQIFNLFDTVGPDYSAFRLGYRHGNYSITFSGRTVRFHGGYAPKFELIPVKGYLQKRGIRPGDVVVDAGAYVGEFTIFAAQMCGDEGTVIAFEPDEENYQRLLDNIELNGLNNVRVLKKGLWSVDGEMLFDATNDFGATILRDRTAASRGATTIEVVSLDNELARLGVDHVDFIKMDIEGAELEAIKGAERTLSQDVSLAIASYHVVEGQMTCHALEEMLIKMGFRCETGYAHLTTCAERPPKKK